MLAGKVSVEFQRRVGVAANTEMSANRPALLLHEVDAKRDASLTSVQTLHPRTCQVAVSQQTLIRPPFQLSGRSSLGPAFSGLKPAEAVGYFVLHRPKGEYKRFRLRAMQNARTPPVSGRLSDCQSAKLGDLGDEVIDRALGKSTKGCLAFQHMVETFASVNISDHAPVQNKS
jgi:hypothetical protein